MEKRKRQKAESKKVSFLATVSTPQNEEEVKQLLNRIGQLQRTIVKIRNTNEEKVAQLKTRLETKITPLIEELNCLVEACYSYASTHRQELTQQGKRKIIKWSTGVLGWRRGKPTVRLIKNEREVISKLEAMGLDEFVNTKKTINKAALARELAVAKSLPGIELIQLEFFFLRPGGGEEISRQVKQYKL